jgi:hypothetical protein
MKIFKLALAAAFAALMATSVFAKNYSLWIHGAAILNPQEAASRIGQYDNSSAFGPFWHPNIGGINTKFVNWAGGERIADQNGHVRRALDKFCTGDDWCYIAAHSAGNAQLGYALSLYGNSWRKVEGGKWWQWQRGWNIKWADIASGAAGGSDINDWGAFALNLLDSFIETDLYGVAVSYLPIAEDLKPATVRAMYDHNETRGTNFYMFAGGGGGKVPDFLFYGAEHDGTIAYHSSGGVSGSGGRVLCNPGKWWCDSLTDETRPTQWGVAKWSNHHVSFIDTGNDYGHVPKGSWQGIVGKVRSDMEWRAR